MPIQRPVYNSVVIDHLNTPRAHSIAQPNMQTLLSIPIRQKAFALFSEHYPSQDRMGGPCWGSPATQGRLQCMNRLDGVFAQQSGD